MGVLIGSFVISSVCILIFGALAKYVGLVDKPNHRKRHSGNVPLVGGLSFYATICLMSNWDLLTIPNQTVYLSSSGVLLVLGALDDRFDLAAKVRLLVQIALSVWLVHWQHTAFMDLGNLFGKGDVKLDASSLIFTIVAIIGAITAFNMIDGLDGLLGIIMTIILLALSCLFIRQGDLSFGYFCIVSAVALIPFIIFNLAPPCCHRMRVFMGDSGSTLLGFTVIWLLLYASQSLASGMVSTAIRPVNALWLVALPIMDMAMVILRRCRKGQSPFKADRLHLHHICMRLGLSAKQTLLLLSTVSLLFAVISVWAEMKQISENVMMAGFLLLFWSYVGGMNRMSKRVKQRKLKPIFYRSWRKASPNAGGDISHYRASDNFTE